MNMLKKLSLVLATGSMATTLTANSESWAADLDEAPVMEEVVEYQPPKQTLVEFGTGWYLRGDLAVTHNELNTSLTVPDWPRDPNFGFAASVGVGAGYAFNNYFRADVTAERFFNLQAGERVVTDCGVWDNDNDALTPDIPVTGTCYNGGFTEIAATTVMLNGYIDAPRFFGLSPYIGGGIGTSYVDWTRLTVDTSCIGTNGRDCRSNGRGPTSFSNQSYDADGEWRLTYALAAGLSVQVNDKLTFDAGYRWTRINGGAFTDPTRATNAGLTSQFSTGALNIHQVKLGMRYAIW
ncbi:MAG: outer membrane beta-barrel protein [Pseudomonadota bacterium]